MGKIKSTETKATELRRRAERRLEKAKRSTVHGDGRRVRQELAIHQVELEMQNDELRRARAQLLGSDRGAVVGRRRLASFAPEDDRLALAHLAELARSQPPSERKTSSCELRLVGAGGRIAEVRVTMVATDGVSSRVLAAIEDITARKRERALRADQRERELVLELTRRELDATQRLHEISMLFLPDGTALGLVFTKILDAAIAIAGADLGDLEILDRASGVPRIRAQRGFDDAWTAFWESANDAGARGAALRRHERIIIEDVDRSELVREPSVLDIQHRAGIRAVFATPLLSRSGAAIGRLTIYYQRPKRPDERALRLIDLLGRQAADLIDRAHAEEVEAMLRHRFQALDRVSVLLDRYVIERRGAPLSDEVLRALAEEVRSVTAAEHAAVGLTDTSGLAMNRLAVSGPLSEVAADRIEWLQPMVSRLANADPLERSARMTDPERALVGGAIRDHGLLVGFICVAKPHSVGDFDADDRITLEMLADRIGVCAEAIRLTRETLDAVRARENLLAIVSHDLHSPLSAIRIAASMLTPESGDRPARDRPIEAIRRAAERMARLIDDLLQAAAIEAGRLAVKTEREDVLLLVRDELDVQTLVATQRSIRLRCEVADDVPAIRADRQRVMQVLSNLVGNALKFARDGGEVVVRAARQGEHVLFAVADDGPGIPETEQARIFERYEQAESRGRRGVGLGLYIARGIVEAHGGRIWVDSPPGAGATFYFTIPVASSA